MVSINSVGQMGQAAHRAPVQTEYVRGGVKRALLKAFVLKLHAITEVHMGEVLLSSVH